MRNLAALAALLAIAAAATPAHAQTCYSMPFGNPDLDDGWGSTCCGRTHPHRGVDFPQGRGTAIPAIADGTAVVNTWNDCLGNVLVLAHADGMFSGYCHMNDRSGVGEGTSVHRGDIIGNVGDTGTCADGPHLHLTVSDHQDGWESGTTIDPIPYIQGHSVCNQDPSGHLDSADCKGVTGWAFDPDAPDRALAVHLYVDAPVGDPAAFSFPVSAGVPRDDLCGAIGSCDHGFEASLPPAFFDGAEHPIWAYAINSPAGGNPVLGGSPRTFQCPSAPLPEAPGGVVRRSIPSPEAFSAWRFAPTDEAPFTDDVLAALPIGTALSPSPDLVRIDDRPEVYVLEYGLLRHIPNPTVLDAWRFDANTIRSVAAAELADALSGADWLQTPFLAHGAAPDAVLIDAPPPLWAEVLGDDTPALLVLGASATVTVRLRNRGTQTWTDTVQLAPTPRDAPSGLCDATWPSCTRIAAVAGEVPTGAETAFVFTLHAPTTPGPVQICYGLTLGPHWFSDPGELGPADDALCHTVSVVAAVPPGEGPDGGVSGVDGLGVPGTGGGVAREASTEGLALDGGCDCGVAQGKPDAAALLLLAAAGWSRRRRRMGSY